MLPIRRRNAIKREATKITYVKEGNQIILLRSLIPNPEMIHEIPLIELIIRKGMSKKSKERIQAKGTNYDYKPSQSYFNFVSRPILLRKNR